MKKWRLLTFVLLFALTATILAPGAAALDDPQVDCQAVVLLAERGDSETVLFTRNEQEKVYPASLTKVMTVLLAVEAVEAGTVKLSDAVTAQTGFDFDLIEDGTSAYISIGETMTLENLLYCAMMSSANDACNIIAQYIGGSIGTFVNMMNARAAELGCIGTNFTNPHGLPDAYHYTTAWDFSRILREAVSHELFMTFCNTVTYTVPATNINGERSLSSTNSLINPNNPLYPGDYYYEYAKGVKTGHTSDAGYCLASTAEKDNVKLLSVVMKGNAYQIDEANWYYGHFADTRTLFEWAFNNFSYQEIVKSTEIVAEIPVSMGADTDSVAVRPSASITAYLPNDVDLNAFTRSITIYSEATGEPLTAPVSAGQTVGEITVSRDGVIYGTAPLVTSTSVELSRGQYMSSQLKDTLRRPLVIGVFWVLVGLFVAYLVLVFRYRSKRKAYQKRLENARRVRFDMQEEDPQYPGRDYAEERRGSHQADREYGDERRYRRSGGHSTSRTASQDYTGERRVSRTAPQDYTGERRSSRTAQQPYYDEYDRQVSRTASQDYSQPRPRTQPPTQRRARTSPYSDISMTPDSYSTNPERTAVQDSTVRIPRTGVDEPTVRVPRTPAKDSTRTGEYTPLDPLNTPTMSDRELNDYFDEFFGKK